MRTAYKYRLYPTEEQAKWFARNFGCCRFIYNQALHWRIAAYEADGTSLSYADTNMALTQVKNFYPWLRDADSASLQMSLRNLDTAFKNFFEGNADYPKHKSKIGRQSYITPCNGGQIRLGDGFIHLPKVKNVAIKLHRKPKTGGKLTNATISREPDGRYYVSVSYEYPDIIKSAPITESKAIGLDMSMEHFFVDNNGDHEDLPHFYRRAEAVLAKEQVKLSHMKRGSNNYRRQKRRVARIHAKTKHQRADWLNKLSYNLVQSYDIICIEDLNMKVMGQGLSLGKSVHDLGWGMFVRMLEYKCQRYGKTLIKVDRFYPSSKTCRSCGYINKGLRLSDRIYICPKCGSFIDRDWQAAMNILDEGLRIFRQPTAA